LERRDALTASTRILFADWDRLRMPCRFSSDDSVAASAVARIWAITTAFFPGCSSSRQTPASRTILARAAQPIGQILPNTTAYFGALRERVRKLVLENGT